MPFETDERLAADVGTAFGEYVSTFVSQNGQVRADLFRRGDRLDAHVSFPTGLEPYEVEERYENDLWSFAHEHGYEDRVRVIFS